MIRQHCLVYLLCWFPLLASAQTNADYQKRYEAAKQQLQEGKYAAARDAFQPLLRTSPANSFVAYAHYYAALAAFKNKQSTEARQLLNTLLEKFPNWQSTDDAQYLLANLALEANNYTEAFEHLKAIRGNDLETDVAGMKRHYLSQLKDLSTLKKLQSTHSNDAVVAEVLVNRLLADSPSKDDQALAERLQKQFKINRETKVEEKPTVVKNSYNVAVLFPFQVDQLVNTPSRGNQFALDMYEGLKLGRAKLAADGIKINLLAYDVANDASKALALINSPEFANVDLIIGPLYPETNRIATSFSNTKQIALINPISYNPKILQDNPFSFLVQTSPEVRATKAADYAAKNFSPNAALIFYGGTADDSVMAYAYRDKVKATGGKVLEFKKVRSPQFGSSLQGLNAGTVGHIFLTTSNQSVATTLMSALAVANSTVPVITNPNLLDFQMIGYDQYERRNVHFIHPEYVNHDSDSVKTFMSRYVTENNIIPSVYAYQGYDLMVYFGQLLGKYGLHFRDELYRQPPTKAMTLSGFEYPNTNVNQYVPLLRFVQSRLVPVNRIE